MTDPVIVVGGSVAALTAADALGAAGVAVELFLPERGIGGGFLPLDRDGRRLDLGPRVIELRYDDADLPPSPPLHTYVPGPHGHRPFLGLLDDFVATLVGDDLIEVPPAAASVGGRRTGDYVLAGDLSGLDQAIEAGVLADLAAALAERVSVEGPHGWFAAERGGLPWDHTFGEISKDHVGRPFHDLLIEPIAAKIVPGGSSSVLAPLHRKIWLPLFHPITAWEACVGRLSYLPDRPFATVAGGGMGEVVRRLLDRASEAPSVTVRREGSLTALADAGAGRVGLSFTSGEMVVATDPVLGVGAEELFAAAGLAYEVDKVLASMVWIDLPESDVASLPSVLFSAEPGIGVMRVTDSRADQRDGWRTVCCEVACDVAAPDREAVALRGLVDLGVASSVERAVVVTSASVPAFAVPSATNLDRFVAARAAFDALGMRLRVVGAPTAFGVDSFNEQVVQGLAAVS